MARGRRVDALVLLDQGARRSRRLHEREAADPFRLEFKQPLDGVETLQDPLGVVEPVHADADADVLWQP